MFEREWGILGVLLLLVAPSFGQDLTTRVAKLEKDVVEIKSSLSRIEAKLVDAHSPVKIAAPDGPPVPHRCTCGCEVTGQCKCPNCSVGCGFLPNTKKGCCPVGFTPLTGCQWYPSCDGSGFYLIHCDKTVGYLFPDGRFKVRCPEANTWSDYVKCPYVLPAVETKCNDNSCQRGYFGLPQQSRRSGCSSGGCGGCSSGGCSSCGGRR